MLATVWVTDCLSEKLVLNKRLNQNMYFLFPIQGSLALFFNSRHMWTLYYTQDMSRVIFGKLLPREVGRTQHGGGLKLPISWIQHRPPTCGRVEYKYTSRTSYVRCTPPQPNCSSFILTGFLSDATMAAM